MKKIIIPVIIVFLLSFLLYQNFFKKPDTEFNLAEVRRGNVFQEVSEVGKVKKGEKIDLGFKLTGIIESIYTEVGKETEKGYILAKIENDQLKIELKESQASLELAQASLDKLLAGATPEEIQIAQTDVDNAQISLQIKQQSLEDTTAEEEGDLDETYEDSLNVLDDSYLKIENVFNVVKLIQRTYFTGNDQEGFTVRDQKDKIENSLSLVESSLDTAKSTQEDEDIDTAISEMKNELSIVFDALGIIRAICEDPVYRNQVTSADKSSLDTQRGYINTALTNIANSQQTISSTKLTNTTNINTAQAEVDSAEGSLKAYQDELAKLIAPPREEDVVLDQAKVKQAEAQVQLLEKQIEDTILRSPVDGQTIEINKRVGELVQPTFQNVISVLPDIPFEIEVDIYEEDVVKMDIGNKVDISLVAFPEEVLKGEIISINPSEKIIEGVVYYEVLVGFDEEPSFEIKPGMTVDLIIKTASKENVLIIPEEAIQRKDDKIIVQASKNGVIEEREIEIGLQGSNDLVEVISGLEEGEEVVLK